MLLWATTALAGSVYLNGVHVEPSQLAGLELKQVTVRMGADGDVHIDAPGYNVRPAGTPAPQASGTPAPRPVVPASPVPPAPQLAPASATSVPSGRWWLYVDDQGSTGHQVTVSVNGAPVKQFRSGDTVILDIGRWLAVGANRIRVDAVSTAPTGGPLYVYIGEGADRDGTVDLGTPVIQYGLGRSRDGASQRDFQLQVSP